ncbi:hypothetical protein [Paraburkholderia sp. 32]|uniref:hypothetical protein n=1 Tax=unclassified Paraburkholderia TaxID=2615204 RepID=UPI003D254127
MHPAILLCTSVSCLLISGLQVPFIPCEILLVSISVCRRNSVPILAFNRHRTAALTAISYALVYAGFGVEAVRGAPPRAMALRWCVHLVLRHDAWRDKPLLGLLTGHAGIGPGFLAGAASVTCSTAGALALNSMRREMPPASSAQPLAGIAQYDED